MAPVLEEVVLADDPATWEALGFTVRDELVRVAGVGLRLAGRGAGEGIVGWRLRGLASAELDGLPTERAEDGDEASVPEEVAHPNGALALDHVVAFTDDLDRTMGALWAAGLEPRRVRDVPGSEVRQAFYVLGPALLELAGPVADREGAGFWGLVVVVADLDALAAGLGNLLGAPRAAVQPGRRIATLRSAAGSSTAVAFMSPR